MLNRKQNNVTNIYAHIRLLLDYTLIHMLPITGLYTYILLVVQHSLMVTLDKFMAKMRNMT